MHKPSRADVLKVAEACFCDKESDRHSSDLMRFAAAMYAAGEEAMRERAVRKLKRRWKGGYPQEVLDDCIEVIRALPITPTNTEGEQG